MSACYSKGIETVPFGYQVGKEPIQEHRLLFELPEETQPHAAALSTLIERIWGYQTVPLQFANIHVPGIRVYHILSDAEATLLKALFEKQLDNLH